MNIRKEFSSYAKSRGISSLKMHNFEKNVFNGYVSPTILEERQLNVAQMDVFSRLMLDRIIFLGSAINSDVSNIITAQLLFLDSNGDQDINMYINSPGGSVYDGLAIYDTMQFIGADVSTIVTGMAASMAFVLATAGEKGKRMSLYHSRLMQHQPMGGAEGQASDIEITAREILKLKKELYEIISIHTNQTYEKIEQDCDRDYWMTATEAKEYGVIDEVLKFGRKYEENSWLKKEK